MNIAASLYKLSSSLKNSISPSRYGILALLAVSLTIPSCKKDQQKEPETCIAVSPAGNRLVVVSDGVFAYKTSGGATIRIEPNAAITIRYGDYQNFSIEFWGDTADTNGQIKTAANHENLNGKHIKDKLGSVRSIVFPDGAKITMTGDGVYGPLSAISIYDGAESHHINPRCNTLIHSSLSNSIALQRDEAEADGETATIEFTSTGLLYINIYTENSPGNKIMERVLLGEIFRNNANKVNDYYDDTRLGHT